MDTLQTQERFDIPCVILAGGKSSRMGADKALLPFGQFNSLAEFQYDKFSRIFYSVYLSAKENKFDFKCNFLKDCDSEIFSPLVALKSAIESSKNDSVFIIAVDYPFISKSSIAKLIQNETNCKITIAKTTQNHNLCGIYSKKILPKIEELLEQNIHKIGTLLASVDTCMVDFEDDEEFCNMNFETEYNKIFNSYKNNL